MREHGPSLERPTLQRWRSVEKPGASRAAELGSLMMAGTESEAGQHAQSSQSGGQVPSSSSPGQGVSQASVAWSGAEAWTSASLSMVIAGDAPSAVNTPRRRTSMAKKRFTSGKHIASRGALPSPGEPAGDLRWGLGVGERLGYSTWPSALSTRLG